MADRDLPTSSTIYAISSLSDQTECGMMKFVLTCWHLLSWIWSLVTYMVELGTIIWVLYLYADSGLYIFFGLTLGYFTIPALVLSAISLIWYYDLDKFYKNQRQVNSHHPAVRDYRSKFTIVNVMVHAVFLGVVYRYVQLFYQTVMGRTANLPFLTRDAALLRFMHTFLITAPEVVIQLYVVTIATNPMRTFITPATPFQITPVVVALVAGLVSLIYTVLVFTTSDRLSGKKRRTVLLAHVAQTMWYACMITSRVIALSLFAHAYGAYVFVVVGVHLIAVTFGLLHQRTTFCNDFSGESPKWRWYLEVPFAFVAAFIYLFVYFNAKEGKTRYWITVYHLLTFVENIIMISLFYYDQPQLSYAPAALTVVIGLYLVGLLFMMTYYLIFHPHRTARWFWVGIPRSCACSCIGRKTELELESDVVHERSQNVVISGPTLVSMNGVVPNLTGMRTRPVNAVETTSGMVLGQNESGIGKQTENGPSPTSTATHVDGNPVRIHGSMAEFDSEVNLPDDSVPYRTWSHSPSIGLQSQSTDVVNEFHVQAGLEDVVGQSDHALKSPSVPESSHSLKSEEEVEISRFNQIPAKQSNYLSQRSRLEQHYFPEPRTAVRRTPTWSQPIQPAYPAQWQRYASAPGHAAIPPPSQLSPERGRYDPSQLSPERGRYDPSKLSPERGRYDPSKLSPERGRYDPSQLSPERGRYDAPHTAPLHRSPIHHSVGQPTANQSPARTGAQFPQQGEWSLDRRRTEEHPRYHGPYVPPEKHGPTQLRNVNINRTWWDRWTLQRERNERGMNNSESSPERSQDEHSAQSYTGSSLERGKGELKQSYRVNLDRNPSGRSYDPTADLSLDRQKKFYWSETIPTAVPPESPPRRRAVPPGSPRRTAVPHGYPQRTGVPPEPPQRTTVSPASPQRTDVSPGSPRRMDVSPASPQRTDVPPGSPQRTTVSPASPQRTDVPPHRITAPEGEGVLSGGKTTPQTPQLDDPELRPRAFSEGTSILTSKTAPQQRSRPQSYQFDSPSVTRRAQQGYNIANRSHERARHFVFPSTPPHPQRLRVPAHMIHHNPNSPRISGRPNGGIGHRHTHYSNPVSNGYNRQLGNIYGTPQLVKRQPGVRNIGERSNTLLRTPSMNSPATQV